MTRRVVITALSDDEADDAVAAANIAMSAIRDLYGHKFVNGVLITSESSESAQLRWLADWLDGIDQRIAEYTEHPPSNAMQQTLRNIADKLENYET